MNKRLTTKGLCGCLMIGFSAFAIAGTTHDDEVNFQLVQPIDDEPTIDMDLARVGWHLFRDPKLSSNGTISCETCHDLDEWCRIDACFYWGAWRWHSQFNLRFNAALNYRFLWDGTANSLMAQIDGPVQNPLEMDSNWEEIEKYVQTNPSYQALLSKRITEVLM